MKKTYLIILAVVLIVIITSISVIAVISNNKSKEVSMENIQNVDNSAINEEELQENVEEYADINDLQGNTLVVEEQNNQKQNTTQNNKTNNKINNIPYYIKVNYGAQVVTIYKQDNEGNYTVPVKAMVCSTGEYTPKSGVYAIPNRWRWLGLQGNVYGQYCTQITGNILFHSVPYLERGNPGSLEYWEYDKLGTYASAGCIRLTVADAIWIYNNCGRGTKVEFYASSDPGPLGKPTAQKISNAEGNLKNWDPTDSSPDNPWKNYKEENINENTNVINNVDTETNSNTQVNESIDTNTETNTNTQVNESINTNTETNTNTQVNESINTNTETNTNTQVNESINTNTETNTNTQVNETTNTEINTNT